MPLIVSVSISLPQADISPTILPLTCSTVRALLPRPLPQQACVKLTLIDHAFIHMQRHACTAFMPLTLANFASKADID